MKTTRQYQSGCTWCNASGWVPSKDFGMNTTPLTIPCPVCNGAKTIIITETIENSLTMEQFKELNNPDK